ncbi:flagellar hook assembly protein FlgD [Dongia sp.]|uniref:flagellar hook assembly protein FlgD n=1 Tax=Dongia sp. TaxID=1977262 RepID=UPI0035B3277A
MEVPSISDTLDKLRTENAAGANGKTGSALGDLTETYDNFLLLLTKQLQNQDPLSPMDTAQFTEQLVSFASVEQMIQQNSRLDRLISLQSSTNAYAAANFLGTEVAVDSDKIMLSDGEVRFDYTLETNAGKAVLNIYNSNNQLVMLMDANKSLGTHKALWDGTDYFGNQLPDGQYRVAVTYEDALGKSYTADITSYGTVDGAEIVDGQVLLNIGDLRIPLEDVTRIIKPAAPVETPPDEEDPEEEAADLLADAIL